MAGLSRRFLNLIVDNRVLGGRSLRCIDLTRHNFFNSTPPILNGSKISKGPAAADALNHKNKKKGCGSKKKNKKGADDVTGLNVDTIQLPGPIFNFEPTMTKKLAIRCFPLAGREVLCMDDAGRSFLYDADTRDVVTMPDLHKPKRWPFSLFVPSTGVDDGSSGSLFIMETLLEPEVRFRGPHSDQFEVFVYHKTTTTASCQLLIPPPFVRDPNFSNTRPKITSYAVVSGGSEICISVRGAGTYCLDIAKHSWRHVGEWTLPFDGKVEYVPELKLWFGVSETKQMAAADLSTMDSQPELVKTWTELSPPRHWHDTCHTQLVNLGSGRFCIARFFFIRSRTVYDHITDDHFVVLTGVDVVPCNHDSNGSGSGYANANANGSGEEKLRMIKYKSKLHMADNSGVIQTVF